MAQQLMPWEEAAQARQNPGGAIIKRADPGAAYEAPKAILDIQRTEQQIALDRIRADRESQLDPLKVRVAQLAVQKAEQELRKGPTLSDGQMAAAANAKAKITGALELQRQLNRIKTIYDADFKGWGPIQSVMEVLPTGPNQRFSAVGESMRASLKPIIRGPSEGSFTDSDQALLDSLIPQPGSSDPKNEERFSELQARIDAAKSMFGGQAPTAPPAANEPPPAANEPPPPLELAKGSGPLGLGASMRKEYDPKLSSKLSRAAKAGLSFEKAAALVPGHNMDRAEYMAAVRWAKANPGYKGSLAEVTKSVPTTLRERLSASPLAAGISGLGNALSMGMSDELGAGVMSAAGQGDYEELRDKADANKKLLAAENWKSDLAGNVVGGVLGGVGALKAANALRLAARARMAGGKRLQQALPVLGETAYGAGYGAGESNDNRLQGALMGGATGAVAGPLARRAIGGVANIAGGTQMQPAVQRLVDQGFVLSPAQRAAGNQTMLGSTRRRVDDALRSSPLIGDSLNAQTGRQYAQLGRATVSEALGPIGAKVPKSKTGNDLVEFANDEVGKAYDRALPGIRAPLDDVFERAERDIVTEAMKLPPEQAQLFQTIYSREVVPFMPKDGILTGQALQDIKRGLDKKIMTLNRSGEPANEYLADTLTSARKAFFDWAERAAPEKVNEFRAANAAFANMVRVNRAAAAAKADGVFSPNQMLGAIKANSSDAQFASGGLPMQRLAQDAQKLIPSTVPTSGTVERTLVNSAGVGLAGGGSLLAPFLNPLLALPIAKAGVHAPGIEKMLQALAVKGLLRSKGLGQRVRQQQRFGGLAVPGAVQGTAIDQ